jgi:superfamily II DNA or RNA helicase
MLSLYTLKYIDLLKEEVELYEWAEQNKLEHFDIEEVIRTTFVNKDRWSSLYLVSAEVLHHYALDANSSDYRFGQALTSSTRFEYSYHLREWVKDNDSKKACEYLAKTANRILLNEHSDDISNTMRDEWVLENLGITSDLGSLPLSEPFLKTSDDVPDVNINATTIFGFQSFDENNSYYSDNFSGWEYNPKKEDFLHWVLLPKDLGSVSIQITPNSYTQIGNPLLENETDGKNVNLTEDVIQFIDGEPKKSSIPFQPIDEQIDTLEAYALDIAMNSKYSIINIKIDVMLSRLRTAADIGASLTNSNEPTTDSISYKLVFDIATQKSVVVSSADMYQSLLYMKAMGTEDVSIYYDNVEKRIVVRGKDFTETITEPKRVKIEGSRRYKLVPVTESHTVPTFAIIYEQDVADLTAFSPVEYVQFFDPELTFREKYDLLNSKRNSPLELPEDFVEEYPSVAATYNQQIEVALSKKDYAEKYEYVSRLIDTYLDTYTTLTANSQGELIREALKTKDWQIPNYVLQVQEAYWAYNSHITNEELLSFFISKGDDEGYRMLSMKIIGVDYFLFEQAIIEGLLEDNNIFVSRLDLDEDNLTAEVKYESKNDFISGNIYDKESYIDGTQNKDTYNKNLAIFFGSGLGADIYDKAYSTITDAKSSRFTPSLVPNVRTEEEAKELQLNIDIFCPVFFSGELNGYRSQGGKQEYFRNLLNTGQKGNKIDMEWDNTYSSNFPSGHFELFRLWLNKNASQILGEYTAEEIKDAYTYPMSQVEYVAKYIFPNFRNASNEAVGFEAKITTSLKTTIKNADDDTKAVLASLGKIKSSSMITPDEVEALRKEYVLLFKERFWDARREGRRLFNVFLRKAIDVTSRKQIDSMWNKMFNNYAKPTLDKVPMFPSHNYNFGKKTDASPLVLADSQVEGIRHLLSRKNSGLLLHEVGFGKTTSSITAISSMLNTGDADRVLFIVPNAVYDKFQDEIKGNESLYGLLPNANVVMIDNLRTPILTHKKKGLKVFSEKELNVIAKFKKFNAGLKASIGTLKRGKITLKGDPLYHIDSNWDSALALMKADLKKHLSDYEDYKVLTDHINHLSTIYTEVYSDWERYYERRDDIITDVDSDDADIKKARKELETQGSQMSNTLYRRVKQYIAFVAVSLIDDLGYYKEHVMAKKTILIAKHTALESLRPSSESILRALMFREGLGEPSATIDSLNPNEWATSAGVTVGQARAAVNILTKHPISLAKLNIDTLVVDEIHNFNNVVRSAGNKGWYHEKKTILQNSSGNRGGSGQVEYHALEKQSGRYSNSRYDLKYDGKNQAASDGKGKKLNSAAVCFDIQYKHKKKNNVILLSATPFTDSPFQVVTVLGMANYGMLTDNGIESAWDFFNNYVDEAYKYDLRHDGGYGLFIDINGYYNDKALSNLITNVANVKITDEKIEARRPKKAIIPQNKIVANTENGVAETTQMGDFFRELVDVNSRVKMTDVQDKFANDIKEYLSNDEDQRPVYEIFPINESRVTGVTEHALDEEVQAIVDEQYEEAKVDVDSADLAIVFLQSLYNKGRYAQHPIIKKGIDDIKVDILKESVDKPDEEALEAVKADVSQMSSIKKLMGKAIGCQQAQQSLVISPYFVNLGDKSYTSKYLKPLEPNPSKVFVESSPKLLFVVKAIQQTLDYQKGQLEKGEIEKIGGQVVYFDRQNFDYGGKTYNAFALLAEYLANNIDGISSDKSESGELIEVGIIDGGTKDNDTTKGDEVIKRGKISLKNAFNDGGLKVLIGSKAIKEGIDLQGNAHTMYICEAEFSPEVAMQLEGRIWRQKNPYDVVRVIYVLAMNTIDSFVYSKINRKVSMIKRMLELGVYEMNTTQFVIDTKEMLIQLESDPDKLTQIQFQDEKVDMTNKVGTLDKQVTSLENVKYKYPEIESEMNVELPVLYNVYENIRKAHITNHENEIRKTITKRLKKAKSMKSLDDMAKANFKGTVKEFLELPKNKGVYTVSDAEVQAEYKKEDESTEWTNPLPEVKAFTTDTVFGEIEIAIQKVSQNLRLGANFQHTWRSADEAEQKAIRSKKVLAKSELIYLAFYDAVNADPDNFFTSDTSKYTDQLKRVFGNIETANVIETYQGYLQAEGVGINDIDSVIDKVREERDVLAAKLDDPDKFKADLRVQWVKALAEREESYGGTLDDLVDTLKPSRELIRIR